MATSTQRHLPFSEIKDDCLVMKDGSLRAAIMTSSINFALKSDEEQEGVVSSYVSFLNSFQFPLQIIVQSRPMRIDNYVDALNKQEQKLTNELLKLQLREYREFVKELVTLGDIMSKRFFIVIPYAPGKEAYKGFFARFMESFSVGKAIAISRSTFDKHKAELAKRADYVMSGLGSMGLSATRLDTQGLIELYYDLYNPVTSYQQKMADVNKLQIEEDKSAITA